jgi:hypothetical protein
MERLGERVFTISIMPLMENNEEIPFVFSKAGYEVERRALMMSGGSAIFIW